MNQLRTALVGVVAALAGLVGAPARAEQAAGLELEVPGVNNFVGLGIATLPDYPGSDDYTFGVAPVGLIHLGDSELYVRLMATELYVNLLNNKEWSLGPVINYRLGRSDVEDKVVDRMHDIDSTVEVGIFGGWSWVGEDPRQRLNVGVEVLQDFGDVYGGFVASASARYYQPVGRMVTLSLGVATTYGSEEYMSTFFGVDNNDAGRSGLSRFDADAGFRDVRISPMAILSFSPNWHLAAGVIYSRLVGDAADSPVVKDRGSEDQLFAGGGVIYAW